MPTYLLTWNPRVFAWVNLAEMTERVGKAGSAKDTWSIAHSTKPRKGDRVFLIRQRIEPRGIVASGVITSPWFEDVHFRPDMARQGKTLNYVDVRWDVLLNPAVHTLLSRARLGKGILGRAHWDSESSGIQIPDEIANALEHVWRRHARGQRITAPKTNAAADMALTLGDGRDASAGFGDPESNSRTERAAVKAVRRRFEKEHWTVKDVSRQRGRGFDLACHRGSEVLHVEVKGIRGSERVFFITAKEVSQARKDPHFHLSVVTRALSRRLHIDHYTARQFLRIFVIRPVQFRAMIQKGAQE